MSMLCKRKMRIKAGRSSERGVGRKLGFDQLKGLKGGRSILLPTFGAAFAAEITYGQNMSVPRIESMHTINFYIK